MYALILIIATTPKLVMTTGQSLAIGQTDPGTRISSVQQCGSLTWSSLEYVTTSARCAQGNGCMMAENSPRTGALTESINSKESPRTAISQGYCDSTGQGITVGTNAANGPYGTYSNLSSGERWDQLALQLAAFGSQNTSEEVLGLVVIHGESDLVNNVDKDTYKSNVLSWQSAFQSLAYQLTEAGINQPTIPLYLNQMSTWTDNGLGGHSTSPETLAQYEVARDNPGVIIDVGPKYQYSYWDGVHTTTAGTCAFGALIGRVLSYGPTWVPLSPVTITRTGAVISIDFSVPFTPMVLDTTTVTDPGCNGFSYTCGSSPPACSSVVQVDGDTLDIVLDGTPSAGCQVDDVIRYAYPGPTPPSEGGSSSGPRGNWRDSSPWTATCSGTVNVYNWLVHFEEAVTS